MGKRSGLRYPEVIDLVVQSRDGTAADLIVFDPGDVPSPAARLDAFQRKMIACANYVADGQLRELAPNARPENIAVRLVCAIPPIDQMRNVASIKVSDESGQSFPLRITVEDETEFRTRVAKELGVMPPPVFSAPKKWWQFWR
jgi:hypothetical protein